MEKTTTKWTIDNMGELMDLAKEGKCDKKCDTCPLFLPTRNECWTIANEKWQKWAKEEHQKFQNVLKEYK